MQKQLQFVKINGATNVQGRDKELDQEKHRNSAKKVFRKRCFAIVVSFLNIPVHRISEENGSSAFRIFVFEISTSPR